MAVCEGCTARRSTMARSSDGRVRRRPRRLRMPAATPRAAVLVGHGESVGTRSQSQLPTCANAAPRRALLVRRISVKLVPMSGRACVRGNAQRSPFPLWVLVSYGARECSGRARVGPNRKLPMSIPAKIKPRRSTGSLTPLPSQIQGERDRETGSSRAPAQPRGGHVTVGAHLPSSASAVATTPVKTRRRRG